MKYTIKLGSCIDGTVPLGWQNENKVKEVYFDASKWVAEYGAGILTLAIQRNGDTQPYPKALTDDTWTIEAVDVEKKGIGEFQVTFTVGEQVKESAVYKFFVERSLDSTGDMPDPYISYFEQIIEVGAQAEADADRAEAAADSIKNLTAEAETLPAGSSASASYDSETGVMTFGIPQGEQGERGQDGVTPDIDIGTVETLETGVPAYANITGTVENPSLNLGLPKGNTGDTGATGAPAGFGAVTATIDGTTGTPSVDVTASGADTAKNFAFAFHNLKGEQGEQGEQGDPGVVQDVTVNGTSVVDSNGIAVITMPELVKTVNGNPIVLDDAFGEVKNLDVELTPIQEGSGTPSPQNVRPITGHDSVTVTDTDGGSQSQSKTVTLPHTVYGAGVGVTSGEGKEKRGMLDLGTLYWVYQSSAQVFRCTGSVVKNNNILCDSYATASAYKEWENVQNGEIQAGPTDIIIKNTAYTDATAFKNSLNGVMLCYELATPTDLSTTPTDLTLYNGDNVVSSDGDMELTYVQDMAIVIRKLEAQI